MNNLHEWIGEKKGEKKYHQSVYDSSVELLCEQQKELETLQASRQFLTSFMQVKQQQIVDACTGLGTLMLQAIYGPEYELKLEFVGKRNKSEAVLNIVKDGVELSPKDETGGGVVDVVALAMRFALWSLMEPRTDPVFIMDEPARFVSKDKLPLLGKVLHEMCDKLGLQLIMVSHEEELIEIADKHYRVEIEDGVSSVLGGG